MAMAGCAHCPVTPAHAAQGAGAAAGHEEHENHGHQEHHGHEAPSTQVDHAGHHDPAPHAANMADAPHQPGAEPHSNAPCAVTPMDCDEPADASHDGRVAKAKPQGGIDAPAALPGAMSAPTRPPLVRSHPATDGAPPPGAPPPAYLLNCAYLN